MNVDPLQSWLREPHTALAAAIADGIRSHVAMLRSRGTQFYGYALLPGEPYDIQSLVAVTNAESDIPVPPTSEMYRYHRYSVDEWANWDHAALASVTPLLAEANARFSSMHSRNEDSYELDEFELAHADALLHAVQSGLAAAKNQGVFGQSAPFLILWISDSDHPIMAESVRQLNPPDVADQFLAEFT